MKHSRKENASQVRVSRLPGTLAYTIYVYLYTIYYTAYVYNYIHYIVYMTCSICIWYTNTGTVYKCGIYYVKWFSHCGSY